MSGALASNPFRGRRASERTHNVCYMASGAASAPVVWRRGCAAVSGRLIASGVTGIPSRIRLAGAQSYRHGPGQRRRGSGIGVGSCVVRWPWQCSQRGERGDRECCALRRRRRGAQSSAGQPRKGARERSDQCGVGGAQRGVATQPPVLRAGGWGNSGAPPKRASGATLNADDGFALPDGVTGARQRGDVDRACRGTPNPALAVASFRSQVTLCPV